MEKIFNALVLIYATIAMVVALVCNIVYNYRIFDMPLKYKVEIYEPSTLPWVYASTDFAMLCLIPLLLFGGIMVLATFFSKE